jgi:hypothetical protein
MSLYLMITFYFGPPLLFVAALVWFALSMRRSD